MGDPNVIPLVFAALFPLPVSSLRSLGPTLGAWESDLLARYPLIQYVTLTKPSAFSESFTFTFLQRGQLSRSCLPQRALIKEFTGAF